MKTATARSRSVGRLLTRHLAGRKRQSVSWVRMYSSSVSVTKEAWTAVSPSQPFARMDSTSSAPGSLSSRAIHAEVSRTNASAGSATCSLLGSFGQQPVSEPTSRVPGLHLAELGLLARPLLRVIAQADRLSHQLRLLVGRERSNLFQDGFGFRAHALTVSCAVQICNRNHLAVSSGWRRMGWPFG